MLLPLHVDIQPAPAPVEGAPSPAQPILDFIASDESLDRYDEVICASGWRLDTYRRNPVFQNAHQYGDILFTLGKALITEVRIPPRPSDGRGAGGEGMVAGGQALFQRIQFATDVNPIARIAYGLYKGKFLNAVSVGFIPLRWQDGDGTEHSARSAASGRQSFQHLRVSASQHLRRKYLEQELLEVSAVGIPANPNALALGLKAGAIEKSDLADTLDLLRSLTANGVSRRPSVPLRPAAFFALPGSAGVSPASSFNLQPATHNQQLIQFARELHRLLRRA